MTAGGGVIAKFEFCVMSEVAHCNSSALFSWPHTVGVMFHTAHIVGLNITWCLWEDNPTVLQHMFGKILFEVVDFNVYVFHKLGWISAQKRPREIFVWISPGFNNLRKGFDIFVHFWGHNTLSWWKKSGIFRCLVSMRKAKADCWEPQFPWIRSLEECKLEV